MRLENCDVFRDVGPPARAGGRLTPCVWVAYVSIGIGVGVYNFGRARAFNSYGNRWIVRPNLVV